MRHTECGFASAKHQLIECESQRICRLAFSAADIVGVPDGVWYTYGVFLHCMVRHVRAPRSQSVSAKIKQWGLELGFQQVGITDTDLSASEPKLQAWLDKQYHGEMDWMARHGMLRARPHELLPGTLRVISVRMNYLPANAAFASTLKNPKLGYVSRYALGRDYHKLLRNRLKKLGEMIQQHCVSLNFRPFVDSAPILERPLAEKQDLAGQVSTHLSSIARPVHSSF